MSPGWLAQNQLVLGRQPIMVGQAKSARWLAVVVVCTAILGTDALPLNEQLEGGQFA